MATARSTTALDARHVRSRAVRALFPGLGAAVRPRPCLGQATQQSARLHHPPQRHGAHRVGSFAGEGAHRHKPSASQQATLRRLGAGFGKSSNYLSDQADRRGRPVHPARITGGNYSISPACVRQVGRAPARRRRCARQRRCCLQTSGRCVRPASRCCWSPSPARGSRQ